jgi:hypothetical protein
MCQLSWSDRYLEVDDNGERPTRRHVDYHSIRLPSVGTMRDRYRCLLLPRLVASRPTAGSVFPEFTAPPAKPEAFVRKSAFSQH